VPAFCPTRIVIHPDVRRTYEEVESRARQGRKLESALWKSFQHALGRLREDGQWGEVIPSIPRYFTEAYEVPNLYCIDLAFFHRAFYTIFARDIVLLDLVDHERHDQLFGRRGRR